MREDRRTDSRQRVLPVKLDEGGEGGGKEGAPRSGCRQGRKSENTSGRSERGKETHFFQQASRVSLFINRPSFFLRIWSYVQQGARGWVAQAESTTIVSPAIKNMKYPMSYHEGYNKYLLRHGTLHCPHRGRQIHCRDGASFAASL